MLLLRPPGVYRPQADTWLLAKAMTDASLPERPHVLDPFTGTGALAIAAAAHGARMVTAVDVSRRAVAAAWCNSRLRGVPIELLHGDFRDVLAGRAFDLVLANPPYVPCPRDESAKPTARAGRTWGGGGRAGRAEGGGRAGRAWNAGETGRQWLDRLGAMLPELLVRGGVALIVHSTLCDEEQTVAHLREHRLKAAVIARQTVRFGPVMRARARRLEEAGVIGAGQRHEELVVVRADRVDP